MKTILLSGTCLIFLCCHEKPIVPFSNPSSSLQKTTTPKTASFAKHSWPWFLQHLPEKKGVVVDYRGRPVRDQYKAAAVIDYDIGAKDLQQCADAIMRLRAEYLFAAGRHDEIRFHFTSGHLYTFADYCKGLRP